ncbi:DUF2784 domain-containing protein [Desulfogranum mediterraneum]|uniref:DUF2784 domain-containing protein n=1 Tax=Desulfogranum mediterraneum TaxID=160661 RepID=UPI0004160C34|nr:DUF2784 domain-containing protein [Desulfogranum mediterraneum]
MPAQLFADVLVILHLGFILFVVFGGFLVLKWNWLCSLHLPAVAWGTLIELLGWQCPLTPVEQYLRNLSKTAYQEGFVEHYLLPLVYPSALTRSMQLILGVSVVAINGLIYGYLIARQRKARGNRADREKKHPS